MSWSAVQVVLPSLHEHGALRDDDGQWRIPVEALLAVGLRPGNPKGPDRDQDYQLVIPAPTGPDLLRVQTVQAELAAAVHRAELAEALLEAERRMSETLRGNVEDLRRQLPPGPAPIAVVPVVATTPAAQETEPESAAASVIRPTSPAEPDPPKRGRWWHRCRRCPGRARGADVRHPYPPEDQVTEARWRITQTERHTSWCRYDSDQV